MSHRKFRIDLHAAKDRAAFVAAFNAGLASQVGAHWDGRSWDALRDYLSWPKEASYSLELAGWEACTALDRAERQRFEEILRGAPHVFVVRT
jgi:hypothetical protein